MSSLAETATAFVEMAHSIVWASAATVDAAGRPRSRVLHPLWEWDGDSLTGWIAVARTPVKEAHLAAHPYVSLNYWSPTQSTCSADCEVEWVLDDDGRRQVWDRFKHAPAPVGYDPAIIPQWRDGHLTPDFAAWRLRPYRLRVMPGSVLTQGSGEILSWRA
jgi:hypothetical protein